MFHECQRLLCYQSLVFVTESGSSLDFNLCMFTAHIIHAVVRSSRFSVRKCPAGCFLLPAVSAFDFHLLQIWLSRGRCVAAERSVIVLSYNHIPVWYPQSNWQCLDNFCQRNTFLLTKRNLLTSVQFQLPHQSTECFHFSHRSNDFGDLLTNLLRYY